MNIVTPIPTAVVFTTANVNTEAARRDNAQRETIPQTSNLENAAAESGLGSESDRVRTAGQAPQPVVYERPQVNQQLAQNQSQGENAQSTLNQDNAEDPSAGRENAESRQQEQQNRAEQLEIEELERRDQEVRAHEQAHAAVGGQYAGAPRYEFETGPDGQRYAVGGEVSIDISEESTPEETLRKMQQVRAAALAPAEPSPQDLRVAGEANQRASEARSDIARDNAQDAQRAFDTAFPGDIPQGEDTQAQGVPQAPARGARESLTPELDDIVDGVADGGPPTRSLNEDPVAEAVGLETPNGGGRTLRENREPGIARRLEIIEGFYQQIATPRQQGVQFSA